jgi:hypothetical protein
MILMQVRAAEAEFRHKLCPPNAWMKVLYQPSCTVTHKGSRSHVYEINTRPSCGTFKLAGPSLEWVAFRSPRPNAFAECPSLKRPGALGRPKMPGSGVLKRKSPAATAAELEYMTCIYQTYTYHLCLLSKICFSRQCVMYLALECICTYWFRLDMAISLIFLQ